MHFLLASKPSLAEKLLLSQTYNSLGEIEKARAPPHLQSCPEDILDAVQSRGRRHQDSAAGRHYQDSARPAGLGIPQDVALVAQLGVELVRPVAEPCIVFACCDQFGRPAHVVGIDTWWFGCDLSILTLTTVTDATLAPTAASPGRGSPGVGAGGDGGSRGGSRGERLLSPARTSSSLTPRTADDA